MDKRTWLLIVSVSACPLQAHAGSLNQLLQAAGVDSLSDVNVPPASVTGVSIQAPKLSFEQAVTLFEQGQEILFPVSTVHRLGMITIQGRSVSIQLNPKQTMESMVSATDQNSVYVSRRQYRLKLNAVERRGNGKVVVDLNESYDHTISVPLAQRGMQVADKGASYRWDTGTPAPASTLCEQNPVQRAQHFLDMKDYAARLMERIISDIGIQPRSRIN